MKKTVAAGRHCIESIIENCRHNLTVEKVFCMDIMSKNKPLVMVGYSAALMGKTHLLLSIVDTRRCVAQLHFRHDSLNPD